MCLDIPAEKSLPFTGNVMVGIIILHRALEEPTDKIMLHRQTNH